jgi:hypothetical protein
LLKEGDLEHCLGLEKGRASQAQCLVTNVDKMAQNLARNQAQLTAHLAFGIFVQTSEETRAFFE